jgi:hypothetical protein
MKINLTSTQLSVISGTALIISGVVLAIFNYQNALAPTMIVATLVCLWFSQSPPRPKLLTIGLIASIIGIIFAACINVFPVFLNIRNTNPMTQPATNLIGYFSGVSFFCGMILILMAGFILIGISFLRSSSSTKASGIFFILGGLVSFAANAAGVMIALSGLSWLISIAKQKRQAEWNKYYDSLGE